MPLKDTNRRNNDTISEIVEILLMEECSKECCGNCENAAPQVCPGKERYFEGVSQGKDKDPKQRRAACRWNAWRECHHSM
jgi:hypothetical protein